MIDYLFKICFIDDLCVVSEFDWSVVVDYCFVCVLFDGLVFDVVMGVYLVQDYCFVDVFLILLGVVIVLVDRFDLWLCFGWFVGMVLGEENDYFLCVFDVLGISEGQCVVIFDSVFIVGF